VIESITRSGHRQLFLSARFLICFGVRFLASHLRRLLMPEDWEGHPLRKAIPWRAIANGPHDPNPVLDPPKKRPWS